MISQLTISLTENCDLSKFDLNDIVLLKMQYWKFSIESHLSWIKENIKSGEYHLLMRDGSGKLLAYLNIVKANVVIDDIRELYLGIGNVCVDQKSAGLGYGQLLMTVANFYLKKLKYSGVLLCKETLVQFYQKAGWYLFSGRTILMGNEFVNSVMFSKPMSAKMIMIERNF